MKTWIVRFASLYAFNLVVLLLLGLLVPGVTVGWSALWASIILTAATVWLKPVISKAFTGAARRSASQRTAAGDKLVQYGIVFLVELIIWLLVVIFSGVRVHGFFWGWVIPPVALLLAWIVYDRIDDRVEARTAALYDRATGRVPGPASGSSGPTAAGRAGAAELQDGLTPEQRRMLDELGNS